MHTSRKVRIARWHGIQTRADQHYKVNGPTLLALQSVAVSNYQKKCNAWIFIRAIFLLLILLLFLLLNKSQSIEKTHMIYYKERKTEETRLEESKNSTFYFVDQLPRMSVPDSDDILEVRAGDDESSVSRETAARHDATVTACPLSQTRGWCDTPWHWYDTDMTSTWHRHDIPNYNCTPST